MEGAVYISDSTGPARDREIVKIRFVAASVPTPLFSLIYTQLLVLRWGLMSSFGLIIRCWLA